MFWEEKRVLTNQVNFKDVSQILPNLGLVMHNLVPGLEGRAVKSSSENNEVDLWDKFWCVGSLGNRWCSTSA